MNADLRRRIELISRDLAELRTAIEPTPSRHARGGAGGAVTVATATGPVVLRKVDPDSQPPVMIAQKIRYKQDPPAVQTPGAAEPTIEAYGEEFTAYPYEGHLYESYLFDKSTRPRITDIGTAQNGTSNTITLASSINEADDFYNGEQISITAGTGAGQTATVADYEAATRIVTITGSWTTVPDATSLYEINRPEKLFVEDFFPFQAEQRGGRWYISHVLRLPPGVKAVDPGLQSEGSSA